MAARQARIAVAGFLHETNTFSPIPTVRADFMEGGISSPGMLKGTDILYFASGEMNNATSGFLRKAAAIGLEAVPILWAEAQPSGIMGLDVFEGIMSMLEHELISGGNYDGLYLDLHGAMLFGEYRNGEEEIIRRLRALVGDIPVIASLDLHANLSEETIRLATMLVACRTYPHVDLYQTGERCAEAMLRCLSGYKPHAAFRQVPFLMPTSSQGTGDEPCASIFRLLDDICCKPAIASASVLLGFPPADSVDCGPSIIVYGDSAANAGADADTLLAALLGREEQFVSRLKPLSEAIDLALSMEIPPGRPVILADVQDNPGGGSGGDSVWIIEELLKRGADKTAVGMLYDPESVNKAHKAGEGAVVRLALGGKMLPGHSPLVGDFTVVKLHEGPVTCTGPMARGMTVDLGKAALLGIGGILISTGSVRIQAADRAVFTVFGLDPASMDLLVLKSFIHFEADFGSLASAIIRVEAPGAEFDDPAKVVYARLRDGIRFHGNGKIFNKHKAEK